MLDGVDDVVVVGLVVFLGALNPLEGGPVGSHEVLPQVPLVLDHLLANVARHPLRLDVHVDDMLLQVERVREGLPAVVAKPGLHASPPISRVGPVVVVGTGLHPGVGLGSLILCLILLLFLRRSLSLLNLLLSRLVWLVLDIELVAW